MHGLAAFDRLTLALLAGSCALVLTALPLRAAAQAGGGVAAAYASYLEADFAAARRHVDEALEEQSLVPEELARAYALSAVLASFEGTGQARDVEQAIDLAVALDHDVALPDGASRVVREAFDSARARRAAEPARVDLASLLEGAERTVEARGEHIPDPLMGRVTLACTSGETRSEDSGPSTARLVVGDGQASCEAALETREGQRAFARTLELAASPVAAPRDDTALWVVVSVVAALAIGAGIAIGVALTSGDPGLAAPTVVEW